MAANYGLKQAGAYNTCWHPQGYCGSHYYSGVSFYDNTGWSGAKAAAVSSSGSAWDSWYVSVSQSVTCPCNVEVGLANFQNPYIPGYTAAYFNGGDPYEIIYNQVYLNTQYTWYTDGTMDQQWARADVRTVTVHEMGHMLGLAHDCTYTAAVMCVTWQAKPSPHWDDWNGIAALY